MGPLQQGPHGIHQLAGGAARQLCPWSAMIGASKGLKKPIPIQLLGKDCVKLSSHLGDRWSVVECGNDEGENVWAFICQRKREGGGEEGTTKAYGTMFFDLDFTR